MSKLSTPITAFLFLVPLVLLSIIVVEGVSGQVRKIIANPEYLVSDQITMALGTGVSLGKAKLFPLGKVVIEDINIAEPAGKMNLQDVVKLPAAKNTLISIARITVDYELAALVAGKGAGGIKAIEIEKPVVNVLRRIDGTINLQDLIKPSKPGGAVFTGMLSVNGGSISYVDMKGMGDILVPPVKLNNLNFSLDARNYPLQHVRMDVQGANGVFENTLVAGTFDMLRKAGRLTASVRGISLPFLGTVVEIPQGIRLLSGRVDVTGDVGLSLARGAVKTTDVSGLVQLTGITARSLNMPVEISDMAGTVTLVGEDVTVDLRGSALGSDALIAGRISGFTDPQFDIGVDIQSANYARVLSVVKLPRDARGLEIDGNGSVAVRLLGSAADPYVEAVLSIPSACWQDFTASDVRAAGVYRGGNLDVRSVTLRFMGADIDASGSVGSLTSGKPVLNIRGHARNVNAARMPIPRNFKVAGIADVDFTVGGSTAKPTASATMVVSKPLGGGDKSYFTAGSLSGKFSYSDDWIVVQSIDLADVLGGSVHANGRLSRDAVDIIISAREIDGGTLAAKLGQNDVSGIAYVNGRVRGSLKAPEFEGNAEIFGGRYREQAVNYARLKVSGGLKQLTIQEGLVWRFPAELEITGSAQDLDKSAIPFSVEAKVRQLSIADVLKWVGQKTEVNGTIMVETCKAFGTILTKPNRNKLPIEHTTGEVKLSIEEGMVYGYPLSSGTVDIAFKDNVVDVRKAVFASGGLNDSSQLEVTGNVNLDTKAAALQLDLSEFDLANVRDRFGEYVYFSGIASASIQMRGKYDDPSISATGSIDNLNVNNSMFESADYRGSYESGLVTDARIHLAKAPPSPDGKSQEYEVTAAKFDTKTETITDGNARFTQVSIADIWGILRETPYLASDKASSIRKSIMGLPRLSGGILDTHAVFAGQANDLSASLTLNAASVGLENEIIDSITAEVGLKHGAIQLKGFNAMMGGAMVSATGSPLLEDGKTNAELLVKNLDLSLLRPFLGSNTPTGILQAKVTAVGASTKPAIQASIQIANPSIQNLKLDSVTVPDVRISLDKSELTEQQRQSLEQNQAIVLAQDAVIALGGQEIRLKGFVPWNWSSMSIPPDAPLDVQTGTITQPVSKLADLVEMLDGTKTTGTIEGRLSVSGTPASPKFGGGIKVSGASLAVKNFKNQFNDVNIDIALDTALGAGGLGTVNQLKVNRFGVTSSLGGKAEVKSGGYVTLGDPTKSDLRLDFAADGFIMGERNLLGLKEDMQGKIAAGISVTGTLASPLIADASQANVNGGVTISNAKMMFAFPETKNQKPPPPPPINPRFNVSMRIGENVLVQPPQLKVAPTGGGTLKGSLLNPDLELNLGVKQGYMLLASRLLKIVPGGSLYVKYAPPSDPAEKALYSPQVLVDFGASTSLTAQGPFGKKERYLITVGAKGSLAKMDIEMNSKPDGLTKEQIMAELGHFGALGSGQGVEIQKEMTNVLTAVGTSTLFSPIERVFVESLGFEQFTLDYDKTSPSSLYFSRRLTDEIYLSFYQGLKGGLTNLANNSYELKLGYRPKGPYQLTAGMDDQQAYSLDLSVSRTFN